MYDDILDAAARVLTEEGYDRTSTTRIADRAGISAGSLYQYFSNRDAIFAALDARQFDQLSDLLTEQIASRSGNGLDQDIALMVDAVFDAQAGHHAVDIVFAANLARNGLSNPAVRRTARITAHIRQLLDRHAADLHEGFDTEKASFSICCLVEGFLHASALPSVAHNRPARVASEIKLMLRGYLASGRR